MNDQIPADKVRAILDEWERIKEHADWDDIDNLVQDVRALLPAPPRPTLADMTMEERYACRWMLCDVKNVEDRAIIVDPCREDGTARVVWPGALNEPPIDWEKVTPRPDVACMTWPGDQEADQ